jgi:cell wall assembly regulator SMI1
MPDELDHVVALLARWLTDAGMTMAEIFGPPARSEELAEVETALGRPLPDDYRRFLTTVGGQRFIATGADGGHLMQLVRNIEILGPAHALGEWRSMAEWGDDAPGPIAALGPVKALFKNKRWLPITCIFGSSQYHCLDLDPDAGGAVGQVIWIADDDEERRVVAPSFTAFLALLARALEDAEPGEEGAELSDDAFDGLLGL